MCVNKMDEKGETLKSADYQQARFNMIRDAVKLMLADVGWPQAFVDECVPILPVSGSQLFCLPFALS